MRLAILFLTMMTIVPLCSHSAIPADLDQGLYWGVEVGDRVDFIWNMTSDGGFLLYEQIYINITYVPPIPDEVNESSIVERPSYDLFYENGTPVEYAEQFSGHWDALPIGNWTFISEITDAIPDVEIYNDPTFFGYTRSVGEWIFYLKSDGLVYKQEQIMYYDEVRFAYSGIIRVGDYGEPTTETTTSETTTSITATTSESTTSNTTTTTTSSGSTDSTLVLIGVSGGGVAVLLALVIVVRSRKP